MSRREQIDLGDRVAISKVCYEVATSLLFYITNKQLPEVSIFLIDPEARGLLR